LNAQGRECVLVRSTWYLVLGTLAKLDPPLLESTFLAHGTLAKLVPAIRETYCRTISQHRPPPSRNSRGRETELVDPVRDLHVRNTRTFSTLRLDTFNQPIACRRDDFEAYPEEPQEPWFRCVCTEYEVIFTSFVE
jgi:hypothetical protein